MRFFFLSLGVYANEAAYISQIVPITHGCQILESAHENPLLST